METFRSLNETYYRNAHSCLLVYDISKKKSFDDCKGYFYKKLKENCGKDIPVILLGNKTDLENERKVPTKYGVEFAKKKNFIFMETSALKNENVADAFETLIELTHREIIKKRNELGIKEKKDNITISIKEHKKTKKIFC